MKGEKYLYIFLGLVFIVAGLGAIAPDFIQKFFNATTSLFPIFLIFGGIGLGYSARTLSMKKAPVLVFSLILIFAGFTLLGINVAGYLGALQQYLIPIFVTLTGLGITIYGISRLGRGGIYGMIIGLIILGVGLTLLGIQSTAVTGALSSVINNQKIIENSRVQHARADSYPLH